jgi:hypothetical protein
VHLQSLKQTAGHSEGALSAAKVLVLLLLLLERSLTSARFGRSMATTACSSNDPETHTDAITTNINGD